MSDSLTRDEVMLTTIDNPFDPFENFEEWRKFDYNKGTDCCGLIARIVDSFGIVVTDLNENEVTERAIDKIVELDPITFNKVYPGDKRYTLSPEEFNESVKKALSIALNEAN